MGIVPCFPRLSHASGLEISLLAALPDALEDQCEDWLAWCQYTMILLL